MLVGLIGLANLNDTLRYSLVPSERMLTPFKKVRAFISGNIYKLYAGINDKVIYTSGATAGVVIGKPVYTNFIRLDEFIGSVPVNSVFQYNQVANMWIDTNCNWADVYGQQASWGLTQTASVGDLDGVVLPTVSAANNFYLSAPLVGSFLQGADKLIPLGAMAPIRIQLTLDSIANIATVAANITDFEIQQPELCFSNIDFGPNVEASILSVAPKIYLKTQGWANASQGLASATSGFNTLVFNHRLIF